MIDRLKPQTNLETRIAGLEGASASYTATGIGCIRDCCVSLDDLCVLKTTHNVGKIHVRVRALVSALGLSTVEGVEHFLVEMEAWRHLRHDAWVSVWGVKLMIDGGIEAEATEELYVHSERSCFSPGGDLEGFFGNQRYWSTPSTPSSAVAGRLVYMQTVTALSWSF